MCFPLDWTHDLDVASATITQYARFMPFCAFFSATRTSSQVTFPVDFFEHNQQLTEVEFGGNDLLQVYNGQQIKHRLNSTGMYVANTKVKTTMTMNISTSVTQFMWIVLVLVNSLEDSRWK